MPSSYWIERGSDGHVYYARQKSQLISFRRVFAEAFRDIRSSNRFSGRPAADNSQTSQDTKEALKPAQVNNGVGANAAAGMSKPIAQRSRATTPQAYPGMAQNNNIASNPQSNQPQSQNPHYPQYPLQYPTYPSFPPLSGQSQPNNFGANNSGHEYQSLQQPDQGALTHYAAPHPRMYPYIPPGSHPVPFQHTTQQVSMGAHPPQGGPYMGQHVTPPSMPGFPPMGPAQVSMTGSAFGQGPEKPKCSECGRTRSSRYRWKHQRKPGQPAKPNICRRCRKTATDSEDEGTNSEDEQVRRYKSHSRHRSRSRVSRPRSRARSSSRPTHRNNLEYYAFQESSKSSSDSDGSEYAETGMRSSGRRRRGLHSSSDEVVRYHTVPVHRSRSRSRKVVYVEIPRDQIEFSDSEQDVEVRYIDHRAR